ncbi:MAG: AAA family ATPase [Chromatiales bacterium]|nr:AAA family ATPase [Chromatiales bacterium]
MYNDFFGLDKAPFKITPDTRLFYTGAGRGEILEALIYAITSGEGIIKIVGEVGTGKTMLCRMLEARLPKNVEILYLANPSLSPEDILHAIALEMELPVDPGANRLHVLHAIQQRLLEKYANGQHVVVLVEEAQSMPLATLEEVRLLSNLETEQDKLLQIVLFGQPELDEKLADNSIRQLKERITHSFYLQPFTPEQTREYVNYRMRQAGYRGRDAFQDGAYSRIARASEGLVRRINIIADKSLLAAFAEDTHDVSRRHVRLAVDDNRFKQSRGWGWPEIALGGGVVLITLTIAWVLVFGSARQSGPVAAVLRLFEPAAADAAAPPSVAEPPAASASPADAAPPAPAGDQAPAPASSAAPPAATGSATGQRSSLPRTATAVADVAAAAPIDPEPPAAVAALQSGDGGRGASTSVDDDGARVSAAVGSPPGPTPVVAVTDDSSPAPRAAPGTGPAAAGAVSEPDATRTVASADLAASSGESLLAERLRVTRLWLRDANRNGYSIQLLLTDIARHQRLESFLGARARRGDLDQIYVYETEISGRLWYGVLYRTYPTLTAARQALEALPPELGQHQPFVRNVRDIDVRDAAAVG